MLARDGLEFLNVANFRGLLPNINIKSHPLSSAEPTNHGNRDIPVGCSMSN